MKSGWACEEGLAPHEILHRYFIGWSPTAGFNVGLLAGAIAGLAMLASKF